MEKTLVNIVKIKIQEKVKVMPSRRSKTKKSSPIMGRIMPLTSLLVMVPSMSLITTWSSSLISAPLSSTPLASGAHERR